MPELPEVETVCRGIRPWIERSRLDNVEVRNPALRWPVDVDSLNALLGHTVRQIYRRGKYLVLDFGEQAILLHLGMSGTLRVLKPSDQPIKHDHIDLLFVSSKAQRHVLRFNDPRRFGSCIVAQQPIERHKLIASLGLEPFAPEFGGEYLFERSRGRSKSIKSFIMDSGIVVGVGNIYASESLFLAGIMPGVAARRLSLKRYQKLAASIKGVLQQAIDAGGTTLNDFTQADGQPGYFSNELSVYGRLGQPCLQCGAQVRARVIAQRNTFYCSSCQR